MTRYMILFCATCLAACGGSGDRFSICEKGERAENGCGQCTCVHGRWDCPVAACADLAFKAGFVDLEPVTYSLRNDQQELTYTSSPARLWTIFQPADADPADKPLVVLFNGGPGSATSGLLFAFNTAKRSLDPDFNGGGAVGPNPNAWTRFANLLYVDARGAGFSYGLMDAPLDTDARQAEFSTRNFNCLLDGADFVRVILRVLARHPALQANPVYIVGESFGGVRATVILHLLLHYAELAGDQGVYQDTALADEIQAHLDAIHPELAGQPMGPEVVAGQFSRLIYIQALLSGRNTTAVAGEMFEQPGSVIYQIAAEQGLTFVPCSEQGEDCRPVNNAHAFVGDQAVRDVYKYPEPAGWTIATAEAVDTSLVTESSLSEAIGIDVTTIAPLAAEGREGAYRFGDPAVLEGGSLNSRLAQAIQPLRGRERALQQAVMAEGDLAEALGDLPDWDTYYTFGNDYVFLSFYTDEAFALDIFPGSERYGAMFLDDLIYVDTFVTHAAYDLMIYSAAQPAALARHADILSACEHDTAERPGVDRPGWMELTYLPEAGGLQRTIRFPHYPDAGHVVEIDQPAELLADLLDWLAVGE